MGETPESDRSAESQGQQPPAGQEQTWTAQVPGYLPPPSHPAAGQPTASHPTAGHPTPGYPAPGYPTASYPAAGYPAAGYLPPGYPPPGVGLGGPMLDAFGNPLPPPAAPPRRRRAVPAATAAALMLIAAAAGVGIGHVAWKTPSNITATQNTGNQGQLPGSSGENGFGNGDGNGFGFGNGNGDGSGSNGSNGTGTNTTEGSGAPSNVSAIAAGVDPGLVDVNSVFADQSAEGAGTGIVLTSTGEILTNNHVINGATSISVTDIGNGKTYTATVVGYSSSDDVAVLQLQNASGLTTAKIGDSSKVTTGTPVVAIGNAGGTGGTPSSAGGSVTALNQSITASDSLDGINEQLSGLIQVNADVQEGDSGGSLVNASGQVIGMDTAASSEYSLQSAGGSGYAIPIDSAMTIAKDITSGKSSSTVHVGATAFLGVLIASSDSQDGSGSGFGNSGGSTGSTGSSTAGAAVSSVVSGGTAQSAGITGGDVITSLNGQTVSSGTQLSSIMAGLKVGQSVELGWVDSSGASHQVTVALGSGPAA
jgi:S1-C subfamily serine protease